MFAFEASAEVKALHQAVRDGNRAVVAEILAQKNVNPEGQVGHSSALAAAVAAGHEDIVTILLEAGAGVNFGGWSGRFPLYIAAHNGNLQLTKILVEAGADIDMKYMTGNTALLEAAQKGYDELVPYLISAGANPQISNNAGETGLHLAAARGHIPHLRAFLKAGVDVNVTRGTPLTKMSKRRPSAPPQGIRGYRPLHLAVHAVHGGNCNHYDAVKFLIAHGADVNAALKNGRTSLHIAASRNAVEIASLLLGHGCHVDPVSLENEEHKTPLLTAVDAGHLAMVDLLIKSGADINFKDVWGFTPLLAAIFSGKVRITLALLRAGCDVNHRSDNGFSAFKASLRHPPHMTRMLVMAGYFLGPEDIAALDEPLNNQLYNQHLDVRAWILTRASNPASLQQDCRLVVRGCVKGLVKTSGGACPSTRGRSEHLENLRKLPLPEKIIDYLNFCDLEDILHLYEKDIVDPVPGYVIVETDS